MSAPRENVNRPLDWSARSRRDLPAFGAILCRSCACCTSCGVISIERINRASPQWHLDFSAFIGVYRRPFLGLRALGADLVRATHRSAEGTSSTMGSVGAAAALARLDEKGMRHALSYAAQQVSGIWSWVRDAEHVEKAFDSRATPRARRKIRWTRRA